MDYRFVDFKPYLNPEDVSNYELFIGPDGEYYKVKTTYESNQNCTHYNWAIGYFITHGINNVLDNEYTSSKCKSELDVLINKYGFIRYTHAYGYSKPFINIPNENYFGYKISTKQIDSLYRIMQYNQDLIDEEIVDKIHHDHGYEEKCDKVFRRIIERRGYYV